MLPNYFYNNNYSIVQSKDTIIILTEMVHDARVIRMGGTHPPASLRKWFGDSIGRWEGDTLVIETTNFLPQHGFRNSWENLKVTERLSRRDANTINYRWTVEDPHDLHRAVQRRAGLQRDGGGGAGLRVRLSRGELRPGGRAARRPLAGGGGGEEETGVAPRAYFANPGRLTVRRRRIAASAARRTEGSPSVVNRVSSASASGPPARPVAIATRARTTESRL